MRIIAFYLPQYHSIPENDAWWGKGFTEWNNVKDAVPLFDGHYQPRIPLHDNYYNLLNPDILRWQTSIASEYKIYGFCIYHYWFSGHRLLEKPLELFLEHQELDFPFCICWANENWTDTWVSRKATVLMEQHYGDIKEWKEHFEYLLPFFKDKRYIKENNKPLVVIYRPDMIECWEAMAKTWTELAKENGFDGILFASQYTINNVTERNPRIDYVIEFQPVYAMTWVKNKVWVSFRNLKNRVLSAMGRIPWMSRLLSVRFEGRLERMDYEKYWEAIIKHTPENTKRIAGAFVDFDNTPRRKSRGRFFSGANPESFERYFRNYVKKVKKEYATDYLFINAWNEWGEGAYLEPDEKNGFAYLEAIKRIVTEMERNYP